MTNISLDLSGKIDSLTADLLSEKLEAENYYLFSWSDQNSPALLGAGAVCAIPASGSASRKTAKSKRTMRRTEWLPLRPEVHSGRRDAGAAAGETPALRRAVMASPRGSGPEEEAAARFPAGSSQRPEAAGWAAGCWIWPSSAPPARRRGWRARRRRPGCIRTRRRTRSEERRVGKECRL